MEPQPPSPSWETFVPVGHLSAFWSAFLLYALINVVLGLLLVVAARVALREHRRLRVARAVREGQVALQPGPATLLGRVVDDGRGAAVHVVLRQRLLDRDGVPVMWEETSRELRARAFTLELASGARVRVEPGAGTSLIASARGDRVRAVPGAERTLAARVEPGAEVLVTGELAARADVEESTYRKPALTLALGPDAKRGLLVSTQPREEGATRRAALVWACALLAALGALNVGLFGDYNSLRLRGVRAWATLATPDGHALGELDAARRAPLEARCVIAHDERDCRVELWLRDPTTQRHIALGAAIPREAYGLAVEYPIARVPVVLVPGEGARAEVGTDPTASRFALLASLVAVFFALGVFVLHFAYPAQPWYRQRRAVSPV